MSDEFESQNVSKRHSKLGIASTVIGITLPVLLVIFIILLMALNTRKNSPGAYVAGVGLVFSFLAPLFHLAGAALGIGGLFTKNTKKLFPIVGTILNIMLGTSGVLLWILVISNLKFGFH